ncbi:MAG: hypothetical protein AB7N76_30110 [Planctomycetota bacterium]
MRTLSDVTAQALQRVGCSRARARARDRDRRRARGRTPARVALSLPLVLAAGAALAGCGQLKKDPRYVAVGQASAAATSSTQTQAPTSGAGAPTLAAPANPGAVAAPGSSSPAGAGSSSATAPVGTAPAPGPAPAPVPQAGPGGLSGPPTRAFPAPASPVTVGQGPRIASTARGDVYQQTREWTRGDLRALDPLDVRVAGDGLTASRELLAFYSRRDPGRLSLRVDLLDLRYGAELAGLDLVVLMGWSGQGSSTLPLGLRETTLHPWDAAFVYQDQSRYALLAASGATAVNAGAAGLDVSLRADLDTIELGLDEAHLRALGWTGQPLRFQVLTVQDGLNRAADVLLEVDLDDRVLDSAVEEGWVADRAALVSPVVVGNRAALSASYLRELVGSRAIQTREGNPTGMRRTLESHAAHGLGVSLHLSGVLSNAIGWAASADPFEDGPAFLADVARFWDGDASNGEGDFLPGLYVDNVMPYFHGPANARFIARAAEVYRARLGVQPPQPGAPAVFWSPERVIDGATFADIRAAGFSHTVLDRLHLESWFGVQVTDGGLHRVNGVDCFVIDPDMSLFSLEDGGPSLALRRLLIQRALDPNAQQTVVTVADWEEYAGRKGDPDVPDRYDRVLEWLAQRPWIEVAGLQDLARRGWTPVEDHGAQPALKTETYDWLRHACEGDYDHWYYGHPLERSLASLQPPIRAGRPSARRLGDVHSPGTLFGDTWAAIQAAPAGRLQQLAEAAFASDLYRTAWHTEDMHDTRRFSANVYVAPDTTFDELSGFAYALQTRVGEAAVIARAARWAQRPPAQATVAVEDVDLDGEDEYLLMDDRLLVVCERDGGRIVATFVRDPATGEGYQVTGDPLAYPPAGPEVGFEGEGHDAPRNSVLKDTWATGVNHGYVNDEGVAVVSTTSAALTFRSSDGLRVKTLELAAPGRVEVAYTLDPSLGRLYLRCGLNPDLAALALDGQRDLVASDQGGVFTLQKTYAGKTVAVSLHYADAGHTAAFNALASQDTPASPRDTAFQHMVELSGDAPGFRLAISADVR